ncbi:putative gustatory receptor 28b [Venturia canescens]|uniref:putative gustatory receptor 28b n=1 Tax=Venturia canescens TaxID=32260 RepID=UPI001C9D4779|nr:putative gustatory receptor 28b [Venturia canescens]
MINDESGSSSKSPLALSELRNPWLTPVGSPVLLRKPRTHNFYGALESVAWIWRMIGIFPVTVTGPMGKERYKLDKFYATYSVLIVVICLINFVDAIRQSGSYYRHHVPMTSITLTIRTMASLLCMILANFWRIVRSKELTETLNEISDQESILGKIGCRNKNETSVKSIQRYVWTTLIVLMFLMAYDFYAIAYKGKSLSFRWFFWMASLMAQVMDLTILVVLVGWIGFKFSAINEKLSCVVAKANASSPKVLIASDVCAENLRALSKTHYNMCALGKRVNSLFDWNVIINVLTAFIILSTTLYYIFFEVERPGETDVAQIFCYIHWEFMQSAPTVVIVIVCNWTCRQGTYAGKLIHEIRVETTDSRLYEAIKSFSLQLHHQKLQFSAGGFFPLNSALLQTMVEKITTYLVILIQFQPNLDDLSASTKKRSGN